MRGCGRPKKLLDNNDSLNIELLQVMLARCTPVAHPSEQWLSLSEFMQAARISRQEVYKRCDTGEIVWIHAQRTATRGPKKNRRFAFLSLSPEGQERWFKEQMARSDTAEANEVTGPTPPPTPGPDVRALAQSPQAAFGFAKMPAEIRGLAIPEEQKPLVWKRYAACLALSNGDYRRQGFRRKKDFLDDFAQTEELHPGTVRRWSQIFESSGRNPASLVNERPGPAPTGPRLDDWQKLFIEQRYFMPQHKPKIKRVWLDLIEETKARQRAWGTGKIYNFPSYDQVRAYVKSRGAVMEVWRLGGARAVSQSLYLDRTFEDERVGDTLYGDEVQLNAFVYLVRRRMVTVRPWALMIMEGRTRTVVAWKIAYSKQQLTGDAVVDLWDSAIRRQGYLPLYWYSDRGGHFRVKLGGTFHVEEREKLLGKVGAGLGFLGVIRKGPRIENPRGNPIERGPNQFVALKAHELPSWCGANTRERAGTGIDEKLRRHALICAGRLDEKTELISDEQFEAWFTGAMDEYNHRPSQANGLDGLAPMAAYREFAPPAEERARRQVTEEQLELAFAEHYPERLILRGGIIALPDGKRGVVRYDSPLLWAMSGERREVVRPRGDDSAVLVLPARKGEEVIVATKRVRVGTRDAQALAKASERLARMRKLAIAIMPRLDAEEKVAEAREPIVDLPGTMIEVSGEDGAVAPGPKVEELPAAPGAPEPGLHDLEPFRVEQL